MFGRLNVTEGPPDADVLAVLSVGDPADHKERLGVVDAARRAAGHRGQCLPDRHTARVGVVAAARSAVGRGVARARRRRAFPVNANFLPPNLPSCPEAADFAPEGSLTARVPVTLYWGLDRNVEMDGFRPVGVPHWLGRFDWVVGFGWGWADTSRLPSSVYCEPTYLPALLTYLTSRWPDAWDPSGLLVVGAGPDFLLSWQSRKVLRGLRRYFSCVYYEAMDVEVPGVSIMPIGLTEHYVRSHAPYVMDLAQNLRRQRKPLGSPLTVLAAWGAWWPGLDALIPDRRAAREFAASSDLVTQQQLSSAEWFDALARFDFMLCPLGNGVQAPKLIEALLMGCVPIATRHPAWMELQSRGVPMLLVDDWKHLTQGLLQNSYPSLFPRVMEFRQKLLDLDQWWSFSFPCHSHSPVLRFEPGPA